MIIDTCGSCCYFKATQPGEENMPHYICTKFSHVVKPENFACNDACIIHHCCDCAFCKTDKLLMEEPYYTTRCDKHKSANNVADVACEEFLGFEEYTHMKIMAEISTRDLVDELKRRKGVEAHMVEPYQGETVIINGPATVLVVID